MRYIIYTHHLSHETEHYQAFAASLPHHSSLLGHLGAAQLEISATRTALLEAKECLGGKRADLVQLWNRGQMLEEMIKILDQMYVYLLKILLVGVKLCSVAANILRRFLTS